MNRVSRHWARLAALIAAVALIAPVLTTTTAAQDGKVLRVHHITYPDVVDPQKSSFTNEIDILALVYEGLTTLDTNQEMIPAAAESWEYNEDATQITFTLRPDL
jgi:ABC-type oligopeptide transport system substrate-binding subunit